MANKLNHTPLPWYVTRTRADGNFERFLVNQKAPEPVLVAICDTVETLERDFITPEMAEANASFIVRACNSHYALVEACKAILKDLIEFADRGGLAIVSIKQAKQAIALAEGKGE